MPSLPDTDTGTSEDIFEGVDREVHFSPRSYLLPLFLKRRARKIFLVPPPFPPNYSPLSLLPAPHLHIPPLISHFPRTLSAPPPLIFTSLPSENSHAIRICRTSITAFSLSHNPPLQNRGGHARQRGRQKRSTAFRNFMFYGNLVQLGKNQTRTSHCMWSSSRMSCNIRERGTSYCYEIHTSDLKTLLRNGKFVIWKSSKGKLRSKSNSPSCLWSQAQGDTSDRDNSQSLGFRKSTSHVTKFTLSLYQVKSNSVQRLQTKSKKYLSKSEAMAVIFVFRSARKKTMKLAEDFQFLLPVTLHQIPYSGCRETIGHGSANQRPGRPSLFSDRPQSTILL